MSKVIIYTRPDGGLSIVVPVKDDQDLFEKVLKKDIPPGSLDVRVIDRSEVPVDRTFRNAWKDDGSKIVHDMSKAREIWREKMRRARKPKLEALDVDYQRADESGDNSKKAQIVAQKKKLRDITDLPSIESTQTPEELKAIWPEELD